MPHPTGFEECELIRCHLLDQLAKIFSQPKRRSWFESLLGERSSIAGIYAFEYSEGNSDRSNCQGAVVQAWLIDRQGIRVTDISLKQVPSDRFGLPKMWYRFPRFHFHIDQSGEWVTKGFVGGPRAGCGGCYKVLRRGDGLEFVAHGAHWRA